MPGNVGERCLGRRNLQTSVYQKNEARKTFNSSQLRGTAAVVYPAPPGPSRPAQLLPPRPLGFCQVFQELSLIWVTSAADVSTHTRPMGAGLSASACTSAREEQARQWAPYPCHLPDGATPCRRGSMSQKSLSPPSRVPCVADGKLHCWADAFLRVVPKSHRSRDCPKVSLVGGLSGCGMWSEGSRRSLPQMCVCAL